MHFTKLAALAVTTYHSLAVATPLVIDKRTVNKDLNVIWKHNKITSQTSLTVFDASKDAILGRSCNGTLAWGNFAKHALVLEASDIGEGTLTVASKKYVIHSQKEFSGGITCERSWNAEQVNVECVVPWTGDSDPSGVKDADVPKCFGKRDGDTFAGSAIDARQIVCPARSETKLVGDGNPHQNYKYKQLSENLYCGKASACSTSYSITKSFSLGWEASVSAAGWISGNFAVQQSIETGNEYVCQGAKGDTVCTFYKAAYTAYTVATTDYNPCVGNKVTQYILFSPNKNNKGGNYMCRTGSGCHFQSYEFWVKSGRAGGP